MQATIMNIQDRGIHFNRLIIEVVVRRGHKLEQLSTWSVEPSVIEALNVGQKIKVKRQRNNPFLILEQ